MKIITTVSTTVTTEIPDLSVNTKAVGRLMSKLVIKQKVLTNLLKQDAPLNSLRHEATNYDSVWREAYAFCQPEEVNMVVSTVKNIVNTKLTKAIYAYKNKQIADITNQLDEAQELLAVRNAELVVCEAALAVKEVTTFIDRRRDQFILADGTYQW